jgi:hypothetical protein
MPKINGDSEPRPSVLPLLFDKWPRPAHCSIEGDYVVARGPVAWYSPTSVKNLTGEFESIADEMDVRRFVAEYGLLRLPAEVTRAGIGFGLTEFEGREPVESILTQARRVARIRKAAALFSDTRVDEQKKLASTLIDLYGLKFPLAPELDNTASQPLSAARAKDVVSRLILQELNEQLPESYERAAINVRGEFQSALAFETLLAVVYRNLFGELQRGRLRLCQECGTVFEWTDPRQMYCGKRCGLNLAQRRYRKGQTNRRRGGR